MSSTIKTNELNQQPKHVNSNWGNAAHTQPQTLTGWNVGINK